MVPAGWLAPPMVALATLGDLPELQQAALNPAVALGASLVRQGLSFVGFSTLRDLVAMADGAFPDLASGEPFGPLEFDLAVEYLEGLLRKEEYHLALARTKELLERSPAIDPLFTSTILLVRDRAGEMEWFHIEVGSPMSYKKAVRERVLGAIGTVEGLLDAVDNGRKLTPYQKRRFLSATHYLLGKFVAETKGRDLTKERPAHLATTGEYKRLFDAVARATEGLNQLLSDRELGVDGDTLAPFLTNLAVSAATAYRSLQDFRDLVHSMAVREKIGGGLDTLRSLPETCITIQINLEENLEELVKLVPAA